jgi:hypothetical protein
MSLKVEVRPIPMGNQRTPGTRSVITCDGVVLSPEEEAAAREAVRALRSPAPTAAEPDHLAMVNDMDVVPEGVLESLSWKGPVPKDVGAYLMSADMVLVPRERLVRSAEDVRGADVGEGRAAAEEAWKHFNDRVRDRVEGEYGAFTNADWQAAVALRAALRSPEPAAEPVAWGVHAPNTDFLFVTAEYDLVRPYVEPPGHHYIVPLYTRSSSAEPATGRDRSQGVTEQELASAGGEPNYTLDEAMDALYDAEREYGASLVGSLSDIFVARLRSGGATTETGEES